MISTRDGVAKNGRKLAVVFPGQGSQRIGMGRELFARFPELTELASRLLGYSIEELCVQDRERKLGLTQYTQPALFVVSALSYMTWREKSGRDPDYLAGHSVGEYVALFAAGVFPFETGVKLVQKRGALMAATGGGGMAAIIGLTPDRIESVLSARGLSEIDIANYNSHEQSVIAGPKEALARARSAFAEEGGARFVELNVSAPFHSRYMAPVAAEFGKFLRAFEYSEPRVPVLSNCEVGLYERARVPELLERQLTAPVRWRELMERLLEIDAEIEVAELGPGDVLTKLAAKARAQRRALAPSRAPQVTADVNGRRAPVDTGPVVRPNGAAGRVHLSPEALGDEEFRREYGVRYAYVAGGMERGIASEALVVRMANAGLLSFFGAKGLPLERIEQAIRSIQRELPPGKTFGVNVFGPSALGTSEKETLAACESLGVKVVEASFYLRPSEALVKYRLRGLSEGGQGKVVCKHRVLAKVNLPEVAELFMRPPAPELVGALRSAGAISARQAELARSVPVADDVCVVGDSGWYTEQRMAHVLVPALLSTSKQIADACGYRKRVRVGVGGGIGTPEAAAVAFLQGADFILTGSVNQCSVEAGVSAPVKGMLQDLKLQDMSYSPAADLFELGVKAQVLAKGSFFCARSNRLYELYRQFGSIDEIDEATRRKLQERYFNASFDAVFSELERELGQLSPDALAEAKRNPRRRMALTFKWYCERGSRLAQEGVASERLNYGIHSGPAMAAFNQWAATTSLRDWRARHVDLIAEEIMSGAADFLGRRFDDFVVRRVS